MSVIKKMAAVSAVVAASAALLTGCQTMDAEDMPENRYAQPRERLVHGKRRTA